MDLFKIIPQVFFDLIGRIVPGITGLFTLSLLRKDDWKIIKINIRDFLDLEDKSEISIFIFIGFAFVLGHLFSPLTKIIQKKNEFIWKKLAKITDLDLENSYKYEWLRLHNSEAGGHCAKLRAEFTMYNTFSAIFLFFAILEVFSSNILNVVILLLLFILNSYRGAETEGTFKKCVRDFYESSDNVRPK